MGLWFVVMSNVDTREVDRDSLFLLAHLKVDGQDIPHRVKVRNLSVGGMMAEGPVRVALGSLINIELRNLGWVEGTVAWKQDNRFGISFMEQIDPKVARAPVGSGVDGESSVHTQFRPPFSASPDPERLRKL